MPGSVLELHFHPLASFCHKALIALYEHGTPFDRVVVDLGDEVSRRDFARLWPLMKFPVLRDPARDCIVAESSVIIEFIDAFHPGDARLIPADPETAWQVRMWDRVFDNHVQTPMQKIVGDRLRPPDSRDAHGVAEAEAQLRAAYAVLEARLAPAPWALGAAFTLADCSAAPALFYANAVAPLGESEPGLRAYLARLMARPSFARVLAEAEPYFHMFPMPQGLSREPPAA